MEHELIDKTLAFGIGGVIARCKCGWASGPHFSRMSAASSFVDHQDKMNMPQLRQYKVGDKIKKVVGDYRFMGIVVSVFTKLNGVDKRCVVENGDGVLHIFNMQQLAPYEGD